MEARNYVLKQTGIVALGQAVCVGAMVGIFGLLGFFDYTVVLGGIMGTVCAVKEETFVIETGADRVRIEMTKWAISNKNNQNTGK